MDKTFVLLGLVMLPTSIYGIINQSLGELTGLLMVPFGAGGVFLVVGLLMDYWIAKWEKELKGDKKN